MYNISALSRITNEIFFFRLLVFGSLAVYYQRAYAFLNCRSLLSLDTGLDTDWSKRMHLLRISTYVL